MKKEAGSLKNSFVLLAGILLVLILGYNVSSTALVPSFQVTQTGDSGAMAMDSNGNIYFSYYNSSGKNLNLCSNNQVNESGDVVWGCPALDSGGDVGKYSSTAVDSNDKVHVSYYGVTLSDLKFCNVDDINAATNGWSCSIWDSGGANADVGRYSSLAANSTNVSVLYYRTSDKAFRFCNDAGSSASRDCSYDYLVAKPSTRASLAFNNDIPHIVLISNSTGKLTHCIPDSTDTTPPTAWSCDVVDSTSGNYNASVGASLTFDSSDKMHIVSEKTVGTSKKLMYCNDFGESWNCINVSNGATADPSFNPSLAVDSENNVHIVFRKSGGLNYCFDDVTGTEKVTCSLLDNSLEPLVGGSAIAVSDNESSAHIIHLLARNPSTSTAYYINFSAGTVITPAPPGTTPPSTTPPSNAPPSGTDTNIYYTNGKVGIAKTNPQYTLDVNGDVGAADFLYTSDLRLKENIAPLFGSLGKILQLKGVSFDWKSNGEKNIGFIAQDVEKIIPELVSTGADGFKSVKYGNIVAILTEAIKEQQLQIEKQQKEINELKDEFERLKNERR